jgi:uncharacterized protein with PIN domain
MKKLTYTEFMVRINEVNKARKIFIHSGITDNITKAFELYQEILADDELKQDVSVSTHIMGRRAQTIFDDYQRPKCPECNIDLRIRLNPTDENGKQWNTAWVCETCYAEFYSDNTVNDWMRELKHV